MGQRFLDRSTVVLVDEASQIGLRSMDALLREVARSGAAVVVLAIAVEALPVKAGFGLDVVVARATPPAVVSGVVRQTRETLRSVVEDLARGDVKPAVAILFNEGAIHEAFGFKAAVLDAVDRWMESDRPPSRDALLTARTNANRLALDIEVRTRLSESCQLTDSDVVVDAVTASGVAYKLALATGDRIRFGARADIGGGVINRSTGTIEAITPQDNGHTRIKVWSSGERSSSRPATWSIDLAASDSGRIMRRRSSRLRA